MAEPTSELTPVAAPRGGAHKRVRWRKPASGKRRPGVLDATRAELVRGLELRQGSLWLRVCRAVSIAGYSAEHALHRVRALRSDGAESLLAMTVALLYLADVRTGFVGRPRPNGGPWERYTLHDLSQLAYGGQSPADLRRARRSLDMMVSLGWASPTKQTRRHIGDGQFRSDAGVRRISFDRICQLTGTAWLLSRDRQHADRTRGVGTVDLGARRNKRRGRGAARTEGPHIAPQSLTDLLADRGETVEARKALPEPAGPPRPPGRPADRATALTAIGEIFKLLGEG